MNNQVKYLIMDVDGTLTDGKIYMGTDGEIMKVFNIKDGFGIHNLLPQNGIIPVIITGRNSLIVQNRCKELDVNYLFQGVSDKLTVMKGFFSQHCISVKEVAYVGDDLNDLDCMHYIKDNGGLIGVPFDACEKLKVLADFISPNKGGDGAVRDYIDWIIMN